MDAFRSHMLGQSHIKELVDIANSADCFPGVNVAGGICYFLWDSTYKGDCKVKNMKNGVTSSEMKRHLGEYDYFVRDNVALSIIRKVLAKKEPLMSSKVFSRNYFGISTTAQGDSVPSHGKIKVLTSKGNIYMSKLSVSDKEHLLGKYKVIITYAMSGGNKPTSEGNYQILSSLKILGPDEACSETYLILETFDSITDAEGLVQYMSGKFARFLLLQALTSIHITKDKFCFVPVQDYSRPISDRDLYAKYGLSSEETIAIESMIKPMELEG